MFSVIKKIHFVGIGGIGMSGIAEILINRRFEVSGSDNSISENTKYLEQIGAKIYHGHSKENVKNAEVVVYSSAIDINSNAEILEAQRLKIPIIRRAEMLAEISRLNYCIAVAGTHGKTTTTSMIALILIKAGMDPTVIVGGRLKDLGGTNARLGKGNWTIVEADEYDRSFLQLTPAIAVINNIEVEHLDIYQDFTDLKTTFAQFANMTPFYGFIAAGIDCKGVQEIIPDLKRKIITYGLIDGSNYQAKNIKFTKFSSICDVFENGNLLGKMQINVPGEFNVKNALCAVLIARQFDIDFALIASVIAEFYGAFRRFEIKGERNGVIVIDDYAHHPTEVKATLAGAKNYKEKRLIAVFQPHTFTRTQEFYSEFAESFDAADIVFVTEIYPARETPIPGITGKLIVDSAIEKGKKHIFYIPKTEDILQKLNEIMQENDIIITLGAGDIWKLADILVE
jgi:UDP-N-acetylmuramate--alanine ligase